MCWISPPLGSLSVSMCLSRTLKTRVINKIKAKCKINQVIFSFLNFKNVSNQLHLSRVSDKIFNK